MKPSPCESCRRQGGCAVMACECWRQWFATEWQAVRSGILNRGQPGRRSFFAVVARTARNNFCGFADSRDHVGM